MKHLRPIDWFFLALLVAWGIFIAAITHAKAESEMRWVKRWHCEPTYGYCTWTLVQRRVYYRPSYAYRRSYDDGWERRDERSEYGEQCKEDHRAIGAVHLTQDGAIKSAVNQWQSEIRYDWGERFMNIENARHYRWRCDRASTNESVAGRVGEAVAGVVGGEGYQKRCIVIAAPCRMGLKRGDEDRR